MKKILLTAIIFVSVLTVSYAQCTKPGTVSITSPSATSYALCEGTALTLSGSVTVDAAAQNTAFHYSWIRKGATPAEDITLQTATLTLLPNTPTTVPDYTGIAGILTDAGTYTLRVEDGNANNAGCYTEANVVVTVNPKPVITSAATGIACSGVAQNYSMTSTIPSSYSWTRATVSGISATATAGSTNPITETLTNTASSSTILVRYIITPTSAASCVGNAFNYDVTINPRPAITSSATGTICSGVAQNYTITSNTTSSYSWTRAAVADISNAAGSGSTNSITEALTNVTTSPVIVRYIITPTSSASCIGTAFNYDVTVNPILTPSVTLTADKTTICSGDAVRFTATPTNGGILPMYQWYKGPSGTGTVIPSATNATYTATTVSNNDSYYVVMTSNAACVSPSTAVSNAIIMTVNTVVTPSVTMIADMSIICPGTPVTFNATPVNGGTTPTYEWSINGANLAANSTSIFTTSLLTSSSDVVRVTLNSSVGCVSAPTAFATKSIIVSSGIGPGTVGSDQIICYNSVPSKITEVTAPINIVGTPTYIWEVSTTGLGAWTTIAGETNATFTPSVPITADLYIRRTITDPGTPAPCNVATSNVIHITVRPQLVAGVIGNDETICSGTIPSMITQTIAPTGGTGIFTYQWESDAGTQGTFWSIPGSTSSGYQPQVLVRTTQFRRTETSGTCGSVVSNVVTKTVTAPEIVTAVIDNTPTQVCAGSQAIVFTANGSSTTGTGTLSYAWSIVNATTGAATPVGTNSSTYTYIPNVNDNGKILKVVVTTSNGCSLGASSATYTLDIVNSATPTVTLSGNTVQCVGLQTTFTASSTGGGNTPVYMWYVVPSGSPTGGPATPVATGGTTYTTSSLANGDRVYVEMTSSLGCISSPNPFRSNIITMTVKPLPAPVITEGDQTVCAPNSFTFHGVINPGNTIEWRQLPSNAVIGTGTSFTASQSGTYAFTEYNGTCSSPSAPVTLTVDPCGAFSNSITGPNPITLGQQNVVYSVANQTGFTYSWSITGGTIVSGQHTNSVTVDWDAAATNAFARTTSSSYSISVVETNTSGQTKTTTLDVNTLTTGVAKTQAQAGINLFPNPTTGSFNIEMPESGIDVRYEILDLAGLSVASGTFTSTGKDYTMDANLKAGMYQIVLTYNNVVTCVRLSKIQ